MKKLLEELEVQIANYESNTWDIISFVLYIKLNGVMYQTHWNGGFENCKQINSVKIIDDIDLVDCGENDDLIDFVNIPFQTELKVPFIRHEFYDHFNQDQLNFLDNFKILDDYKKLPGCAVNIHEETLLTF